ncbi:MAG: dTDP-4-dehydrorhamnose reductase [Treponema sp.]|nr:dTDP-4-dehydrorhamnose reductase [Treponema sp.]
MIWLIASKGLLGSEIARQLRELKVNFIESGREVDITKMAALLDFAAGKKIDYIINCAAYTFVDKAESEKSLAYEVNQKGSENIAKLASKIGAKLIHISTDYVFDGKGNFPLTEEDRPNPISEYGKSKLLGEEAVSKNLKSYYIIRSSWLYGFSRNNFVYTMLRLMNSRQTIKVVDDQRGSPTFAADLAEVIIKIVEKDNLPYGIYNFSDSGQISWWEFAKEIYSQALKLGLIKNPGCKIISSSSQEYASIAKRPSYSVLSKEKIQNTLGITIPDWKESLNRFLSSADFDREKLL